MGHGAQFLDAHVLPSMSPLRLPWWLDNMRTIGQSLLISVTAWRLVRFIFNNCSLICRPTIPAVETMATWPGPKS